MELLGCQGITSYENYLIREKLEHLVYRPLTRDVEDAVIAATALCSGLELLTLDKHLLSVVRTVGKYI